MAAPYQAPPRRAAAALLACLAACSDREPDAPRTDVSDAARGARTAAPSAGEGAALRRASNAGGFVAEVRPLGGDVPLNAPFAVELRLFAADGTTPLAPEHVTLDARMEEHEHGMLRDVELVPTGPGTWRADGLLFHMLGLWQFQVDVREGARVERAELDFRLS